MHAGSRAEIAAWTVAVLCLGYAGIRCVDGFVGRRLALRDFNEQRAALSAGSEHRFATLDVKTRPDTSLWSPQRVHAWQASLVSPRPMPLAILRIPRIHLEVPVLEGSDDETLNRAAGHIEQTAVPGTDGNAGIAGHRDGYFRVLKDVVEGDEITLETLRGSERYRIVRTWIVDPSDVSVLDPTPERAITLVTCYPFYFVGSAPQRFIVRAVAAGSDGRSPRG